MKLNSSHSLFSLFAALVLTAMLGACHHGYHNETISNVDWSSGQAQEVFPSPNTESYSPIVENEFTSPVDAPFSTFSIDVDAASYANTRRFIQDGQLPPADAVRSEELINYFTYSYPQPEEAHPFSINTEVSSCPWAPDHQLVHVGLQGKEIPTDDLPPSNLVFLIDVSGSMSAHNKLPLLKQSLRMLVEQLRAEDRVSIVVYAGSSGMVLEPTRGNEKWAILDALNRLEAGGGTAGAEGIELAYEAAERHFMAEGNNRIVLATDGDFNIGPSSDMEMERLIEEKRDSGIFLTVLGFGMGYYKDSKMQVLADKGNGNHAYIDNLLEARKVLVNEFGGTLFTIAKDVKLQVEFNPEHVSAYRLIGYENRMLQDKDFNDDTKDAGELGSGHSVTALYEIIPVGVPHDRVDASRYQKAPVQAVALENRSAEMGHIKFRYKTPEGSQSRLLETVVSSKPRSIAHASENFRWSAAVAEFSLLLRNSRFKGDSNYDQVLELAQRSLGEDPEGFRQEFIGLVKQAKLITSQGQVVRN